MAIAAGLKYSLALKADGSIVGWGYNGYGQATPPEGDDFLAIAAGRKHSLALKSDGSIVGWGSSDFGRQNFDQVTPPAGNDFIAISAGEYFSLALQRVCLYVLVGDLNDDCEVDFDDFAIMATNWLIDCYTDPNNPACVHK